MKNRKMKKTLKWLIFIAYIAALVYFMFFAEILGRTDVSRTYRYNLVPFKEIKRFVNHFWQLGLTAVLANIAGNVVAFMPFGFCLPLIADHRIDRKSTRLNSSHMTISYAVFCLKKKKKKEKNK